MDSLSLNRHLIKINEMKSKFICPGTYIPVEDGMEHPSGESQTIPDDAFSIGEILERFTSGVHDSLERSTIDLGEEPDIDADAENPIDLVDVHERLTKLAENEKLIETESKKPRKAKKSELPEEAEPTKKAQATDGVKDEVAETEAESDGV